jgi:hypothetical protein
VTIAKNMSRNIIAVEIGGDVQGCTNVAGAGSARATPQCQQRSTADWAEQQQKNILPVTYYHLVFTLPHELNGWVQLHPSIIYRLLFKSVWHTLKTFAANPKRLNGKIGMTAVLHTWGQNLSQHVHLHCLVPGGALQDTQQWKKASSTYLFPVRALSRHFRGNMVSELRQAANDNQLNRVIRPNEVNTVLDQLMKKDWAIYSKPCLNHTDSIVGYLARYTHRIAISNQRIINISKDDIRFSYKDYKTEQNKSLTLTCDEFIRRFLLHVLPKGLMRVRHYGFLANCCRQKSLDTIRQILAEPGVIRKQTSTASKSPSDHSCDERDKLPVCPHCHQGHLQALKTLLPVLPYPPLRQETGMT